MTAARLALLVLALAACNGPSATPYVVALVTPSGVSPLAGDGGVTHVSITLKQGTAAPFAIEEDLSGPLMRDVPITDLTATTSLRFVLTTAAGPLVGAPPDFRPDETNGLVRVPVGPPSTCAVVTGETLATARARPAVATLGTFALVSGDDGTLEFADGLALAVSRTDTDVLPGLTDLRLVSLGTSAVLALSRAGDVAVRYQLSSDATMRARTLGALHAGARDGTLLSLGTDGAVILGGTDGAGVRIAGITFVGVDGGLDTLSTVLAVPRTEPAAARLASGAVLVAGGAAPSAAVGELVARLGAPAPILDVREGERRGAALFLDATGRHAVLVGGVDEAGAPVPTTVLFDCTGATCAATMGPLFPDARGGTTAVALPGGGGLLVGGRAPGPLDHVTHVRVGATGAPSFDALHLAAPRAEPAVYALASGVVYVVGGAGASGPRDDFEVCFPDVLAPL